MSLTLQDKQSVNLLRIFSKRSPPNKWSIYKIRNRDVIGSIEVEYEFENDTSEFFIVNMYTTKENDPDSHNSFWRSWHDQSTTNLKDEINYLIQEMQL